MASPGKSAGLGTSVLFEAAADGSSLAPGYLSKPRWERYRTTRPGGGAGKKREIRKL